ncbi:unnamed protein product [Brachionus calyciflorus]|uniref:Uncharacterized protein n=1 Tax=Brachionus calyciflorus TaxID=104777 RepID=A0A814GFF1_9BILA|nr:unnamed protein product [Brachionus calyciflorus]
MAEKQVLDGERNMEKAYQSFVGPVNEVEDGEIVSEHEDLLISSFVEIKEPPTSTKPFQKPSFSNPSPLTELSFNEEKEMAEKQVLDGERNMEKTYQSFVGPVNEVEDGEISSYVEKKQYFTLFNEKSVLRTINQYLDDISDEHQDEVSVLKNTIFDLELKIRNLEGINKSEKDLIRNISYDFEEVNDHHDSLRHEITKLKNQLNLSEIKYSNLLNDYEVTNNLLSKSEQDKNKYMENIDNLRSEITKIRESHSTRIDPLEESTEKNSIISKETLNNYENESLKNDLIKSVKHIEELNIIFQNEIKNIKEDYEDRKIKIEKNFIKKINKGKSCDEFNHINEKEKLAREFSEKIEILKNDYQLKNSLEFKRIKDEKDLEFSNKEKKNRTKFERQESATGFC